MVAGCRSAASSRPGCRRGPYGNASPGCGGCRPAAVRSTAQPPGSSGTLRDARVDQYQAIARVEEVGVDEADLHQPEARYYLLCVHSACLDPMNRLPASEGNRPPVQTPTARGTPGIAALSSCPPGEEPPSRVARHAARPRVVFPGTDRYRSRRIIGASDGVREGETPAEPHLHAGSPGGSPSRGISEASSRGTGFQPVSGKPTGKMPMPRHREAEAPAEPVPGAGWPGGSPSQAGEFRAFSAWHATKLLLATTN